MFTENDNLIDANMPKGILTSRESTGDLVRSEVVAHDELNR